MTDMAALLNRAALFQDLTPSEAASVVATAKVRSFAAGTEIVTAGDPGAQAFYLVISGAAEVLRGGAVVARVGPGDYFGEVALLLDDTPRTASVVALEATDCLAITRWDLRALITSHPEIGVKMMGELARRLRDTDTGLSH